MEVPRDQLFEDTCREGSHRVRLMQPEESWDRPCCESDPSWGSGHLLTPGAPPSRENNVPLSVPSLGFPSGFSWVRWPQSFDLCQC